MIMKNSIYDDMPEFYWEIRKWWMFKDKVKLLQEYINKTKKCKNVLDFWSWNWEFLSEISKSNPNINFYWYDLNENYINYSKKNFKNDNLSFIDYIKDILHIEFDIIYINDVIHHFPDEKDFLNLISTLKFEHLFIIEPNQFNLYILFQQYRLPWERNFKQLHFRKILSQYQLEIIDKRYLFTFPNNIKKLSPIFRVVNNLFQNNKFIWWAVFYFLGKNKKST